MPVIVKKQPPYYTGLLTVDPHLKRAYEALLMVFNDKYHQHIDDAFEKLSFTVEMLEDEKISDYHAENPTTLAEVRA